MATTANQPTLAAVDRWFRERVLPARTAYAGFSPNRLWKGPVSLVRGNEEDPNGLCGDAALYVHERFFADFGDYRTSEGHIRCNTPLCSCTSGFASDRQETYVHGALHLSQLRRQLSAGV